MSLVEGLKGVYLDGAALPAPKGEVQAGRWLATLSVVGLPTVKGLKGVYLGGAAPPERKGEQEALGRLNGFG